MRKTIKPLLCDEGFTLLIEGSLSSILFNVLVALLLGIDLVVNGVTLFYVLLWFSCVLVLSVIRWLHCQLIIRHNYFQQQKRRALVVFLVLTFSCYARSILSSHIFKLPPCKLICSKDQSVLNGKMI